MTSDSDTTGHTHNIEIRQTNYKVIKLSLFSLSIIIENNHDHVWDDASQPSIDDINGVSNKIYTIHSNDHSHQISISSNDFENLRKGASVILYTSDNNEHNHKVTLSLTNRSIETISSDITTNITNTSIGTGHKHNIIIPTEDLLSNNSKIYQTDIVDSHKHDINLEVEDFIKLRNGETVRKSVSVGNMYTHEVTINGDQIKNYIIPSDNPYSNSNNMPEIYAHGFNKPTKLIFTNKKLNILDGNRVYYLDKQIAYESTININTMSVYTGNNLTEISNKQLLVNDDSIYYLENGDITKIFKSDAKIGVIRGGNNLDLYLVIGNNQNSLYRVNLGGYNPISSFTHVSNSLSYLNVSISADNKSCLLDTNCVPNYNPIFRNTEILGVWGDTLSRIGITNKLINSVDSHNYGWMDSTNKYGTSIKIPLKPTSQSKGYWGFGDEGWCEMYPDSLEDSRPIGPIGIAKNGVFLYNDINNGLVDKNGGSPNEQNIYRYNRYSGFLETGIDDDNSIVNYLNNQLSKTGWVAHSSIIGYAFDGYPIYGPIGFVDNYGEMVDRKVKLMSSSYDDINFVEGLGDLDICNGRFSSTPEYPDGIYHYHMTIEITPDGLVKTGTDPYYAGNNEIDGQRVIIPKYPYILGRFRGVPEKSNLNLPLIDGIYTEVCNIENCKRIILDNNTYYILDGLGRLLDKDLDVKVSISGITILDAVVHLDYSNKVYLKYYTNKTIISEYDLTTNINRIIYTIDHDITSNMVLNKDQLYISVGDWDNNSQNLTNVYGCIVRISLEPLLDNNIVLKVSETGDKYKINDQAELVLYRGLENL